MGRGGVATAAALGDRARRGLPDLSAEAGERSERKPGDVTPRDAVHKENPQPLAAAYLIRVRLWRVALFDVPYNLRASLLIQLLPDRVLLRIPFAGDVDGGALAKLGIERFAVDPLG